MMTVIKMMMMIIIILIIARKGGNCDALQLEAARRRASCSGFDYEVRNAPASISTQPGNARLSYG